MLWGSRAVAAPMDGAGGHRVHQVHHRDRRVGVWCPRVGDHDASELALPRHLDYRAVQGPCGRRHASSTARALPGGALRPSLVVLGARSTAAPAISGDPSEPSGTPPPPVAIKLLAGRLILGHRFSSLLVIPTRDPARSLSSDDSPSISVSARTLGATSNFSGCEDPSTQVQLRLQDQRKSR
jgi:hypothetical protein